MKERKWERSEEVLLIRATQKINIERRKQKWVRNVWVGCM